MSQPQPKCANCGHPEGKHSRGRRGGCSVRTPVRFGTSGHRGQVQLRDCPCSVYKAPDGKTAPTIAELIAQDRARLAEAQQQAARL